MGIMVHKRIAEYIEIWEKRCYKKGIPDEAPIQISDKVPSYKAICIALLKNDMQLTNLGYQPKHSNFYSILKKIEIDARDTGKPKQLKLF